MPLKWKDLTVTALSNQIWYYIPPLCNAIRGTQHHINISPEMLNWDLIMGKQLENSRIWNISVSWKQKIGEVLCAKVFRNEVLVCLQLTFK